MSLIPGRKPLEDLKDQHAIIPVLLAYREAAKRVNTYGEGWSKWVHPMTDRVHPDWKQIETQIGGMACQRTRSKRSNVKVSRFQPPPCDQIC